MASSSRAQVISLYRTMLKESQKFSSYNYRTYALRRVRDAFRANGKVEDPVTVERLMEEGRRTLGVIQRQVRHTTDTQHTETRQRQTHTLSFCVVLGFCFCQTNKNVLKSLSFCNFSG
uniref:Complex 1 LYR protein domain-containing protein n=2 Tax=Amphiprion ocellaris TaxID=80972 RepID=A0A3Q1BDD6_AMPOC